MTTATQRPVLSLVKDADAPLAAVEGVVVEHQGETVRPAWIESAAARAAAAKKHAKANRLYAGWTVRGYRELARRWLDARHDDYPHMIATARAELQAAETSDEKQAAKAEVQRLRAEYRLHKRWHWAKTGGWGTATAVGGAIGVITGGPLVDALMALGATATGIYHGRPEPRSAEIAAPPLSVVEQVDSGFGASDGQVFMTVDQLAEGGAPFPVAQARTPMELAECVLRALLAEGVPVAEVSDVIRLSWGWQCTVRVSEGTPEAIIKTAGGLETRFDLAANGIRPTPLKERRACAVLRLVDRGADPFASAPGLPYRAPKSVSITERFRVGTSVGGDPLAVSLAGVMGLVVATTGGGKTGVLQGLAEGATACHDNITIDLDPHGDGLEDLHDGVRITARANQQIEAVLLFLFMLSKGRARLRKKLGMGRKWKISREHPHFTVFFDEFPKASELAKRLAFELLLVGRKEAVALVIASQGGTKLYLGENFAQMVALKAVGPCKVGDTRAVFGDGSVAEGYLPHRLAPATDTDPKDAGHVYVQGVPGVLDEPIEYKIHEVPSATLRKLATERLEAGLVEPDQDSLDAMAGVDLPEYVEPVYDMEGDLKKPAPVELLSWEGLLRLCGAEPPARADAGASRAVVADALDLMTKAGVDRMRTETLVDALVEYDPESYGDLTPDGLKALLADAGAGKPVTLGPLDGLSNPRGFKRDALTRLL